MNSMALKEEGGIDLEDLDKKAKRNREVSLIQMNQSLFQTESSKSNL